MCESLCVIFEYVKFLHSDRNVWLKKSYFAGDIIRCHNPKKTLMTRGMAESQACNMSRRPQTRARGKEKSRRE